MAVDVPILKFDSEQQLVFGWANVAVRKNGDVVIDHVEDTIAPEDLELAAYAFTLHFGEMNADHRGPTVGQLVESFMVTPQKLEKMGLPPDALPVGWWVGFHVEDPSIWAQVKDGHYSMFSIEGMAVREDAE